MIPQFLQAAQITPAANSQVLSGFNQGVKGTAGILDIVAQKQQAAQNSAFNAQKLKIMSDQAASQKIEDERNWEIAKTQLGLKQKTAPIEDRLTEAKIDEVYANIGKTKADTEKTKSTVTLTPGQQVFFDQDAKNFANDAKMAGDSANKSAVAQQNLDIAVDNYNKLPTAFKGNFYANAPKLAESAAYAAGHGGEFDAASKNFQQLTKNTMDAAKSARITNAIMNVYQKGTISLGMSQKGVEKLKEQGTAINSLAAQYPLFYEAMADSGVTSAVKANAAWDRYQKKYPILDEKGKAHMENLDKWQEFIPNSNAASPQSAFSVKTTTTTSKANSNPPATNKWNSLQKAIAANPEAFATEAKQHDMTVEQYTAYLKSHVGGQ